MSFSSSQKPICLITVTSKVQKICHVPFQIIQDYGEYFKNSHIVLHSTLRSLKPFPLTVGDHLQTFTASKPRNLSLRLKPEYIKGKIKKYRIFSNLIRIFLQFQRAKISDADYIRGRELDFGKMIKPLYVP